jgi:hypothetical protein
MADHCTLYCVRCSHKSVVTAQNKNAIGYGMYEPSSIPGKGGEFCLHHRVQTGSGANLTNCYTTGNKI